jgi:hypothetical protein
LKHFRAKAPAGWIPGMLRNKLNSFPIDRDELPPHIFDMGHSMKTAMIDFKQEVLVRKRFRTAFELNWLDQEIQY